MVSQKNQQRAEQNRKKNEREREHAVAGNALFFAQGVQTLHAAGGEQADQSRIAGARTMKMTANAMPQRWQIVFAHAEVVENFRRFAAGDQRKRVALDFFKNRFGFRRRWRGL